MVTMHQATNAPSNVRTGGDFELAVKGYLEGAKQVVLQTAFSVPVGAGDSTKAHRFDLGAAAPPMLVECKSHRWTETGNLPSAKVSVLNEAMYLFSLAPAHYQKILVMTRATHPRRAETLAELYVRNYGHLIPPDVELLEYDETSGFARCLRPMSLVAPGRHLRR